MTSIDSFYRKECGKIDAARCVDAYLKLKLDEENPVNLILESSWETTEVDLTDAIKAGETLTHLFLSPDCGDPVSLQYNPERGEPDCIHGDDLSRIISMTKLKDVDQETAPQNGDVYIYRNGKFYTFNLTDALADLEDRLGDRITNLLNQISAINAVIAKPQGIPADTRIVWGNINLISDYTNNNVRDWGLFTHSIDVSADIPNDEIFS